MPSTLFFNGRILTGERLLSPSPRIVEALFVEDGIVVAAGDTSQLASLAQPDTERVDLHKAFCMPGFNDAHLHLGEGARLYREVDLSGARSLEEALARIARAADPVNENAWLTGGGWDETLWPQSRLPSRYDLDRVTGARPAVFARSDIHLSVANSAALARSGITRATRAPDGSAIDCDPAGEPTGILRERPARDLVERHIPSATCDERMRDLRQILAHALACGITSVQDNSIREDFDALCALHRAGDLPLRVSEWLPFNAPVDELNVDELDQWRAAAPQDRFLRTTMLKAFLDGSLGSRTAALLAPYADQPETSGLTFYNQHDLNRLTQERAAAGWQLGFHAIGDRALNMALTAFESAPGGARFRIEHAQVATQSTYERAQKAGVIASMQPNHLLTDMRWTDARLGPERACHAYAWRSFAQAGVPLAFGTDYPVEPLTPLRGLYAALTRQAVSGGPAFHPEQCLTINEALYAYTQGAAFAEHSETWKGILAPGYVADLVALDCDLLTADPRQILTTQVLRTVVAGRTVFQAPERARSNP